MIEQFANSGDPDQMLHSAASDLGLHSFQITLLGVPGLQWVNYFREIEKHHCLHIISTLGLYDLI